MTESSDISQKPQDHPTPSPVAGPPLLDPSHWEDFEGFRETFLLNFTDPGDNAAFRVLGRALYNLVLEAAHVMPAHPEGWIRIHVRAAVADLRFLQGFLAFLAEERGEVEMADDEAELCHIAGEKALSLKEIADAIEAQLADSDEAGHPFRRESGHPFRGEGGHPAGARGEQGSWWIEVAALRPVNGL